MDIVQVYQKQRREFGRQCLFSDRPAEIMVEMLPDSSAKENYIPRDPADQAVQNSKEFSEHEANTERVEIESRGINHTEGGWPKDVDHTEAEQVSRFRKKVEKDEHYMEAIINLGNLTEEYIKQNNGIDIYENYFENTVSIREEVEPPSAKTVNVFKDPSPVPRTPVSISWFPDGASKLAVAYNVFGFQQMPEEATANSYIWDVENPAEPETTLTPSSPLFCLNYNHKDVNVLIGGCYNGQIAIWDLRKSNRPHETSPIEKSHRDPVHDAKFLNSKTGTECFSVSTDGTTMWWDTRNMAEPTEVLELDADKSGKLHGGIVLDYESTMPTKFLVGTEQGSIILGNRKGKTPADKIAAVYQGHYGPVNALQRNPFYPKYFLSVGDWTARIWSEDIKESPISWTKKHQTYLTHGCWSYSRPAVYLTSKADGTLDVWDLLFKKSAPCLTIKVTDSSISHVNMQADGSLVACGAVDGTVTLLKLGDNLSYSRAGEKQAMSSLMEHESAREKLLVGRMREINLARKSSRIRSSKIENKPTEDEEEDPLVAAEKNFFEALENEKNRLEKERMKQQKKDDAKEAAEQDAGETDVAAPAAEEAPSESAAQE